MLMNKRFHSSRMEWWGGTFYQSAVLIVLRNKEKRLTTLKLFKALQCSVDDISSEQE